VKKFGWGVPGTQKWVWGWTEVDCCRTREGQLQTANSYCVLSISGVEKQAKGSGPPAYKYVCNLVDREPCNGAKLSGEQKAKHKKIAKNWSNKGSWESCTVKAMVVGIDTKFWSNKKPARRLKKTKKVYCEKKADESG